MLRTRSWANSPESRDGLGSAAKARATRETTASSNTTCIRAAALSRAAIPAAPSSAGWPARTRPARASASGPSRAALSTRRSRVDWYLALSGRVQTQVSRVAASARHSLPIRSCRNCRALCGVRESGRAGGETSPQARRNCPAEISRWVPTRASTLSGKPPDAGPRPAVPAGAGAEGARASAAFARAAPHPTIATVTSRGATRIRRVDTTLSPGSAGVARRRGRATSGRAIERSAALDAQPNMFAAASLTLSDRPH